MPDTGHARVYDLAAFRTARPRACAICATAVRPSGLWADLEGRVWDVCRACGDGAVDAAAQA
jgi:sugar phosphate isomerase/epimerase